MTNREHLRLVREPRTAVAATSMETISTATTDETTTTSMVAAGAFTDDWSAQVCKRFEEIGNMQPGWDGYNADRIARATMHFALLLLGEVKNEASALTFPSINPMSNGSIMMEWRTRTHELTVEVNGTNDVDVLIEAVATGGTDEFHITSEFSKISDALEQSTKPMHAVA